MARTTPAAGQDQHAEWKTLLKDLVGSLEKTLADPDHTLTLAHRDQLELAYRQALRLCRLKKILLEPSAGELGAKTTSSPSAKTSLEGKGRVPQLANLPDGAVEAMGNGKQKRNNPAPSPPPRRILVVDDKIDSAQSLAMLLRLQGHQVETAYDGPTAIQTVRSFSPEIVLLDIGLPGMSGYEVAKHLQQEPTRKNIYLVALTGYGQPEDRLRSSEAGFDSHLVKPASLKALTTLISLA